MLFDHPKIPEDLEDMYQQKNEQGKFLHEHSNAINQSLAMTSIGANFMRWDGKKFINEKQQDG